MNTISIGVMRLSAILIAAIFTVSASVPATATSVSITTFKGAWVAKDTYSPGELVTYQGGTYLCLVSNKDVPPTTNSSDWSILGAPAPLVRDSTGQVVGPYMLANAAPGQGQPPADYVFISAFSRHFAIAFTASQLGAPAQTYTNVLWFTSSDCSGTPYYFFGGATQVTALSIAGVGGTIAYVLGTPGSSLTAYSYMMLNPGEANGDCNVTNNANYYFPVVATYDLSALKLVPPFSVH